jgi:LysM repeat protein
MKMKNLAIVLLFLALLAVTAGCDRIASIPPIGVAATPTGSVAPFPVGEAPNPTDVAKVLLTTVGNMAAAKDGAAPTATATPAPTTTGATDVPPTATPVPATSTPAPVTPTVVPVTYALAQGEWAICVARRFNLDLDAFFAINNINMNTRILPVGYVLSLPASGSWTAKYGPRYWHAHPGTYVVQPGDSINHIACFFGDLKPADIEAANGLHGSYTLNVGQTLSIP